MLSNLQDLTANILLFLYQLHRVNYAT
jgi:hypothetical protein